MGGTGYRVEDAARYGIRDVTAAFLNAGKVKLSAHHQGRDRNVFQSPICNRCIGVHACRGQSESDSVHLVEQLASFTVHAPLGLKRAVKPETRAYCNGFVNLAVGFCVCQTGNQIVNPRRMDHFWRACHIRRNKNKRANMCRISERCVECDAPSLRAGHQNCRSAVCHRLDDGDQILNGRMVLCFGNCFAKTSPIIGNGLETRADFTHLVAPHPAIRDAGVQKHDRVSIADDFGRQSGAAGRDAKAVRHELSNIREWT
ncbi:hypothetical protein BLA18112_00787 [Burkholderia lata]|uniref:Uncharacterized protein n=1 Tax=Burkholderia lata (strain ATCC 17760 / DSM 23089 / LMG 22485 / NCIMB 9086 / R18194 / 383) TaxID=482957 RepID=A0A6P2TPV0_BURL3|nr:hypothetical protein BLA18112_00787 [Burkholderia lata]